MRMKLFVAVVLGMGLGISNGMAAAPCTPEAPGEPEIVQDGLSGVPPAIHQPIGAVGATKMQVEYWKDISGVWTLFARGWLPGDFIPEWAGEGETNWYIRSATGPGGFRIFSAGTYRAQWRGNNSCGYGPWATSTPFQVSSTTLTTQIAFGPTRVESDDDIEYQWENNFAASRHQVQIRRGAAVVRSQILPGMFQNGWLSYGYGSYQDRPASPSLELPNGTTYVFRVSSWSSAQGAWSPWASQEFTVARGTPQRPIRSFRQKDYDGIFNRSPRPFFCANYGYGHTPALWTYFDIRRQAGDRLKVVRQKWISRYEAADGLETGTDGSRVWLGGVNEFADLRPGTYVWRVLACNGPQMGQRRWMPFQTSTVVAAGALARPGTAGFGLQYGYGYGNFRWRAVPNAYAYNLEIRRDGVQYSVESNLDARVRSFVDIWKDDVNPWVNLEYTRWAELPFGYYRFRVQGVNRANPAGDQLSPWSPWSREFPLQPL